MDVGKTVFFMSDDHVAVASFILFFIVFITGLSKWLENNSVTSKNNTLINSKTTELTQPIEKGNRKQIRAVEDAKLQSLKKVKNGRKSLQHVLLTPERPKRTKRPVKLCACCSADRDEHL